MLNATVNEAQSKAITHGEGPMLVLAGPGSGKTLVITQRIKYLIEENQVKPEHILVITFTKAAALEMQKRFLAMTENRMLPVMFGTFHAIFFQILKQTYSFNATSIIKESQKIALIREVIKEIPEQQILIHEQEDEEENIHKLLSEISKVKNCGLQSHEFQSEIVPIHIFSAIYQQYCKKMSMLKKVDFDDMVLLCYQLLHQRTDVLKLWQERFRYILIDEFQDINPLQYKIIQMLASPQNNLFIVGDDDQAIYGFRGSDPEIMRHFQQDYPNVERVLLNINYRSNSDIVDHANQLIKHNVNRFDKEVIAQNTSKDGVRICYFESRQEQTKNIVSLIRQYMRQPGAQYKDIALIYRTNTHATITAEKLLKEKIPFQMKEKTGNIYNSAVAKDIIAYLTYALYQKDIRAFYRIMNRPVRYIRRDTVPMKCFTMQELVRNNQDKEYVIRNITRFYEQLKFLKGMSPYAAINFIRKGIGYDEYLRDKAEETGDSFEKWEHDLKYIQESASDFDTLQEWLLYVEHYEENLEQGKKEKEDAVNIVTMHGSKGLEWPIVIIPDVNEGHIPHKKAITDAELEEERRMFFVAMTRAKEKLFLFSVKEKEAGNSLPSRFIYEFIQQDEVWH
ncbi:MAG: ATP-dependent helicase [Lachnospiraceae bacterium]|nr:ATP-dependent helicase [Lachnospiraceae bacterium]